METAEATQLTQTLIPFAFVVFVIAVGVALLFQKFREKLIRQRLEKEELKNQHQLDLLRSAIAVQEEERKRFARDLHDELSAVLAVGKMNSEQLALRVADPAVATEVQELQHLFQNSLQATRQISHALMPPELVSLGLEQALRNLARRLTAQHITPALQLDAATEKMPWETQLALYRMCSELMHNTLKHAEATEIHLQLQIAEAHYRLEYHDNGVGLPAPLEAPGLGLKNLEARASALGGVVHTGNRPEGGFFASVQLPLLPTSTP